MVPVYEWFDEGVVYHQLGRTGRGAIVSFSSELHFFRSIMLAWVGSVW